ncbi:MAG: LPS export ABC transporter permease LptG [Pseudomonadota bacterium]
MILHFYLIRRFMRTLFVVFAIFLALTLLLDFLEHLRKFSGRSLDVWTIGWMVALLAPNKLYQIFPLIVIISSVTAFLSLSRSSELVIARAAGRSATRFLVAPIAATFVLGLLMVAIFNPIVAGTTQRYEQELSRINGQNSSALTVSSDGIWLRQDGLTEDMIIQAARSNLDGTTLFQVQLFGFDPDGQPLRRINAERATLESGFWQINAATEWALNVPAGTPVAPQSVADLRIPTNLTINQIRDSFGAPSAVAIWDLPGFIQRLEDTGFSARRHTVWFQMELALPLFLSTLALIGAAFTIAPSRLQNSAAMVLTAILLGFLLYFVRNFAQLLGENGQISAVLAAWVPPIAAFGFAAALVLQQEDG